MIADMAAVVTMIVVVVVVVVVLVVVVDVVVGGEDTADSQPLVAASDSRLGTQRESEVDGTWPQVVSPRWVPAQCHPWLS